MRYGLSCLPLVMLVSCPASGSELPTAKPEEVGVSSEKVEELSTFMQSLVDDGKIAGGVTMMARHGKVIHLKAVGMADWEAKRPMTTDAVFRIASMTKPITSVAIMMLWEQGKLGLDDPVSKYIPEFKNTEVLVKAVPLETEPAKREITIRHLLTHMSGLGYPGTEKIGPMYVENGIPCGCVTSPVTLEESMKKLARMPLLFHPGEKWEYGMSTDVLGRVVEVVSEMPLDRFFEDRIFKPLGMNDSFFKVQSDKQSRVVAAYIPVQAGLRKLNDGEIVNHDPDPISADYPYAKSHKYLSGGGDLCSTPNDYMRFCQMLLGGGALNGTRLLKKNTVRLMATDQTDALPNNFGFGFTIFPDEKDVHKQLRDAYAWFGYWSTSFRISPRGDWILVTMAQTAWRKKVTPKWFVGYEKIAAESIID